jgi:hypothetical protein
MGRRYPQITPSGMDEKVRAVIQGVLDRQSAEIGATGAVVATLKGGERKVVSYARSNLPSPLSSTPAFCSIALAKRLSPRHFCGLWQRSA